MGALDHLLNFCVITTTRSKRKPMQTVEIKVKMDCDGCERRVKNAVKSIKGVKSLEVNRKESRVTVSGNVDPNMVLNRVKRTGKRAEFWPYIPHNLVHYPQSSQAYDKRAPSGYVKNVIQQGSNVAEERLTYIFSDDNPNACSIM
ncbi:hypothetical protein LguiB_033232 [Lonicera macranthoides]